MAPPKRWRFNGAVLAERYWKPGMSQRKLAAVFGCCHHTIGVALVALGIERRLPGGATLEGRWSRLYNRCVVCGETERPHAGRGMCTRCKSLLSWRKAHPGRRQRVRVRFPEWLTGKPRGLTTI